MTEAELELVRLKMKIEALYALVHGLYTGLANSSPIAAKGFRDQFAALRQLHAQIVPPNMPPAYSDLVAAEYGEILSGYLTQIESGFRN